jgi:hypothetical protein
LCTAESDLQLAVRPFIFKLEVVDINFNLMHCKLFPDESNMHALSLSLSHSFSSL